MTRNELGLMELSVLREITNIGLGHAATALAEITGRTFSMTVPEVESVSLHRMSGQLGSAEELVVSVYMEITGELSGHIAFIMRWRSASELWQRLVGSTPGDPRDVDEMAASAFLEAGNVINSSFLNAISDMTGLSLHANPPTMAIEMAFAILETVAVEASAQDCVGLSIRTQLEDSQGSMDGQFVYIPSSDGLRRLLDRLCVAEAA